MFRFGGAAMAIALLSACTSTEATLDPSAVQAPATSQPAVTTAPATTPASPSTPSVAANAGPAVPVGQPVSIQFASILGAPALAVSMFTTRLNQEAPRWNVTVAQSSGPGVYALKGFLSTSPESGKTFIYYSWDISDQSGAALHRLTGKQAATGSGEGWTSVTQADMEAVADQTLSGFAGWLSTR